MPVSTVVQAVIGGITVRTGLLWWTVAIHLLVSMTMVWLSVLLYVKVGEPDDGVVRERVARPLRALTALTALDLAVVLVTGTLVTAAGPHAGDRSPSRTVPRLKSRSPPWCTCIRRCWSHISRCWSGWASGCWRSGAARAVMVRLGVLLALVCAQAAVGTTQYFTGVPAALVAVHVAGAAACTAATAALWASSEGCENGPSPSRSQADSTAKRELALGQIAGAGVQPPPAQRRVHQLQFQYPTTDQMDSRVEQLTRRPPRRPARRHRHPRVSKSGSACGALAVRWHIAGVERPARFRIRSTGLHRTRRPARSVRDLLARGPVAEPPRMPVPMAGLTNTLPVRGNSTRSPAAYTWPDRRHSDVGAGRNAPVDIPGDHLRRVQQVLARRWSSARNSSRRPA